MLLRSLLFVPGNRANMLEKALGLDPGAENRNGSALPDAFIPDMEDSVPEAEKANARGMIAQYLPRLAETGVAVIPRVNALDSGLIEDDLKAIDKEIKKVVNESADFAKESPEPHLDELWTDIYATEVPQEA